MRSNSASLDKKRISTCKVILPHDLQYSDGIFLPTTAFHAKLVSFLDYKVSTIQYQSGFLMRFPATFSEVNKAVTKGSKGSVKNKPNNKRVKKKE